MRTRLSLVRRRVRDKQEEKAKMKSALWYWIKVRDSSMNMFS